MLRDYQIDLIEKLRKKIREGERKIVAVMPTGAGKTFTFTHIVKKTLDKGGKILIITDRIELMKQAGGALNVFGMEPIRLEAGSRPHLGGSLYTAMVETLHRRMGRKNYQKWLKQMSLVIIDECHMRAFDKLFPHFKEDAVILGFTATPIRIGHERQLGEFYDSLVVGIEIEELIQKGFLSHPHYYGVKTDLSGIRIKNGDFDQNQIAQRFSENKVYEGVAQNLMKYGENGKTLVFSPNIASSRELEQKLAIYGFYVRHLDSTMSQKKRADILHWFNQRDDAVLCNVGILTKGFDEPTIRNIVLYRATQSLPLYLQMIGRGSRVIEGEKDEFNVLDFGGNIERHGYWHDPKPWSLEIKKKRERTDAQVLKQCKGCGNFIPAVTVECPECGYIYEREKKEREFAMLQKLDPRDLRKKAIHMSLAKKIELSKAKVIKPYWVLHKLKTFGEVKDFVRGMGWSPYWFEYNYHRFWWADEYVKERSEGRIIRRTR